jgi:hypothetical protein
MSKRIFVAYDADNGFSPKSVLHFLKAIGEAQRVWICAVGGPTAENRLRDLASSLLRYGVRHADLRMALPGPDAADDLLVDCAVQYRWRDPQRPMQIVAFTHDKRLIERLNAVADTVSPKDSLAAIRRAQDVPSAKRRGATDGPCEQDALKERFFAALLQHHNAKTKSTVHMGWAAFCYMVCASFGVAGRSKADKQVAYATALRWLEEERLGSRRTGEGDYVAIDLARLRKRAAARSG